MKCPKCNGDTKVTDSASNDTTVFRLRRCKECNYKFGTAELFSQNCGLTRREIAQEIYILKDLRSPKRKKTGGKKRK